MAGDSLSHLALLTTLSALVDKSLLRRSPSGRYEMLEVVRQFAEQKLADTPAEWTRIKDLHCDYFAEFLQQLEGPLRGADQQEALSQITEEIDNVRSGWAWAVDQKKSEDIERMLESLYQFYERRSWLQEGVDALGLAVIALGGTADVIMAPGG